MRREALVSIFLCAIAVIIIPPITYLIPLWWSQTSRVIVCFACGLITYMPAINIAEKLADRVLR